MKILKTVIAGHLEQEVIYQPIVQKMTKRGIKRFDPTSDIEEAVYYQDLIQVYRFENITSYESIYKEEEVLSHEESDGT